MSDKELLDQSEPFNSRRNPFKNFVTLFLLSLFLLGMLFEAMHWPGHSLLRLASFAGMTGFSLALLLLEKNTAYSLIIRILNVGLMVYFTWEIFVIERLPYDGKVLIIYSTMFVLAPLLFIVKKRINNRKVLEKQKNHF